MSKLMALSISTGVLCGIWSYICGPLGLLAWIGFAGCTTYFACGKNGLEGIIVAIRQNLFGVLCGTTIIFLCEKFAFETNTLIFSGLITFVMCIAAKSNYLAFIPGTFVGSFSTFAATGVEWYMVAITLVCGAILGISCDKGGELLFKLVGKPETATETIDDM